ADGANGSSTWSGRGSWRCGRSAPERWLDAKAVEQLHRLRVRRGRRAPSKSVEDVERASMLAKGELAAFRGRAQSAGTLGIQSKVPWPHWGRGSMRRREALSRSSVS